jgi:hypothetical protein
VRCRECHRNISSIRPIPLASAETGGKAINAQELAYFEMSDLAVNTEDGDRGDSFLKSLIDKIIAQPPFPPGKDMRMGLEAYKLWHYLNTNRR